MQLIIGQRADVGDFLSDASVIPTPIPWVGAVDTKPTAKMTNSRVILMTFDM